jgi:hypothetical protein
VNAQLIIKHDQYGNEVGEVRGTVAGPLPPETWQGLAAAIAALQVFSAPAPTPEPQPEGGAA